MRDFLNSILAFIGLESLTDDEFDSIELDSFGYDNDTYLALSDVLKARETVSNAQDLLRFYFLAKGAELDPVTVGRSNIFMGAALDYDDQLPTTSSQSSMANLFTGLATEEKQDIIISVLEDINTNTLSFEDDSVSVYGDLDALEQLNLLNATPLTVAIVDDQGSQISSFGGGQQYTEGDVDASIMGTAMMWEDAGNVLRAVSAANPLPVIGEFELSATDLDIRNLTFADDSIDVSGSTVSVDNFPSSFEVSGTVELGATSLAALENISVTVESIDIGAVDTELPDAVTLGDNLEPASAPYVGSLLYGYVSADDNWDRWRMAGDNADGLGTAATGHMQTLSHGMMFNGTSWDRVRGTVSDGILVNLGANNDVVVTSSALPDGGSTSANQDTIITILNAIGSLLTTIDGDTSTLAGAVSGSEMQVDIVSSALPSGAATSANQSTMIGHIDGIETLLTTIDADTGAILTGMATAANQSTIIGHIDGIETLLGTTNTNTGNAATSLAVIDDWDESDRAKVNIIVGQAGITAGAGAVGASTPRMTLASDDPAVASLSVIDDWDESDRAKVNIIVGQAGVAAGAGTVSTSTIRVTHASDDPVTTALQIIDDWDESDRAKVNIIVGQAGITAGAGAVAANTPRVTHASDDPVTTALQIMDDWDESDRAKVNPIVGQAGVQGGSGTVSNNTQRVVLATDVALPAGTNNIGKTTQEPSATVGGLTHHKTDALVATAVAVKAGAGQVYGYHIYNPNTADAFVHFYNIAQGSVTVGTSTRIRSLWIPAGGAIDASLNYPITFGTAITIAATTTLTGSSAPSTGLLVNVEYV